MSDRAGYAGVQVEVDDLHRVRAILRTSDYSGAQAELEAALRDVDESVFADRLLGAVPVVRFTRLRRATRPFPVMGKVRSDYSGATRKSNAQGCDTVTPFLTSHTFVRSLPQSYRGSDLWYRLLESFQSNPTGIWRVELTWQSTHRICRANPNPWTGLIAENSESKDFLSTPR